MAGIAACTLADGHYHLGVGVLANSLYRSGFRGDLWVGYRGDLPGWAQQHEVVEIVEGMRVRFLAQPSGRNLAREKPGLMLRVLELDPAASGVIFFDADVVVRGAWHFFETWLDAGAALVIDGCYPLVPAGHPWRHHWGLACERLGLTFRRPLEVYFGSAFLGIRREHAAIAEAWRLLLDAHSERAREADGALKHGNRCDAFFSVDQDCLNAAAMATSVPLSAIGPEAMDFVPSGYLMAHPVHAAKPWRRNYLWHALLGQPPFPADKEYWRFADGPVRLFGPWKIGRTRLELKIAGLIGRFYRRA